jgi:hypothetical protein
MGNPRVPIKAIAAAREARRGRKTAGRRRVDRPTQPPPGAALEHGPRQLSGERPCQLAERHHQIREAT